MREINMRCGTCGRETDGFCEHCERQARFAPVTYWGMVSSQQFSFYRLFKRLSLALIAKRPMQSMTLNMRAEHLCKKARLTSMRQS